MANQWTYGMYDPERNEVKWGRSINPFDRLKDIRSDRPHTELVVVIPDHSVEYELHDKFAQQRQSGEWFTADDEVLAFVEQTRQWTPRSPSVVFSHTNNQGLLSLLTPRQIVYLGASLLAIGVLLAVLSIIVLITTDAGAWLPLMLRWLFVFVLLALLGGKLISSGLTPYEVNPSR